ncbi:Secretory immunoglobulin A-binding protein EsiB [Porphyridium purpureum]|uniref:Secretory immunoglobulin A-binding protein EsiB n=1 Tax=Porphyridium purpureum TaxID=35688 RepID=A0A5J4Z0W2_PORPP|nr:Secretory immunoglobulin A-binding protein EsiB [Porphyridium purpureum]|eukprot:POR6657..scf295_1
MTCVLPIKLCRLRESAVFSRAVRGRTWSSAEACYMSSCMSRRASAFLRARIVRRSDVARQKANLCSAPVATTGLVSRTEMSHKPWLSWSGVRMFADTADLPRDQEERQAGADDVVMEDGARPHARQERESEGIADGADEENTPSKVEIVQERPTDSEPASKNKGSEKDWLEKVVLESDGGTEDDGVRRIRELAEQGDPDAQVRLGQYYESGKGGLRLDMSLALEWYRRAADQFHAPGEYEMGVNYYHGDGGLPEDERTAIYWFHRAAKQGHAPAQFWYGFFHEFGKGGLAINEIEAAKWYRKSAKQGYEEAQFYMGYCYEHGTCDFTIDKKKAEEWYNRCKKGLE